MNRYQITIANEDNSEGNTDIFSGRTEEEAVQAAKAKWDADWDVYPFRTVVAL